MNQLIEKARFISSRTPSSIIKQILSAVNNTQHFKNWVYNYSISVPCVHLSAIDLFDDIVKRKMKFLIVDCRPNSDYAAGALPESYHVDPAKLTTIEGVAEAVKSIIDMSASYSESSKCLHITVVGIGGHLATDPGARSRSILMGALAKADLPCLSVLRNGFQSCHEHFLNGEILLDHHNEEKCSICIQKKAASASLFSALVSKGASLLENFSTSIKSTIASRDNVGKISLRNLLFGDEKHSDEINQADTSESEEEIKENEEVKDDQAEEKEIMDPNEVQYVINIRAILGETPSKDAFVTKSNSTEEETGLVTS